MDLADALTFGVLALVGVRLVEGARHATSGPGRRLTLAIVRGIRWRHVWPVPFVLTGVISAAMVLVQVPGLDWGWWTALGGEGNPVFGSSASTEGTVWGWIVPVAFLLLLVPAIPVFAHAEERMFRAGAEHWSTRRRAAKVVQFGLVHAVIGIPLGVAVALSIGGAYFMAIYLRRYRITGSRLEAVLDSTRAHAVYNTMIVTFVVVAVVGELVA